MTYSITSAQIKNLLPLWLRHHLFEIYGEIGGEIYLAGGVVRDLLLAKKPEDIDLSVDRDARKWASRLAAKTGGAYVALGRDEDAARVVAHGLTVDFSAFRLGARTIVEELRLRDLSINSLAVRLDPQLQKGEITKVEELPLIDPTGGLADLEQGLIRMAGPTSFTDDPLRLLRVFRFAATLGFDVDTPTRTRIGELRSLILRPAPERIAHELDLIMASGSSHRIIQLMVETGLLWELIPELAAGRDMEQPSSHHLDVFGHSLEALKQMEYILADPGRWFPENGELLSVYISQPGMRRRLCWAALMHDVGKPPTYARRPEKADRITFYHHDHVGARILEAFGLRLRWSNEDRELIGQLIYHHMRPFFLANVARERQLTLRACIRLLRKVGDFFPGLFLLAMADSLSGQGESRIEGMEQELSDLYLHLVQVHRAHVAPVMATTPFVDGHDLIKELNLQPGPIFKSILSAVEEAQMEGLIATRSEALDLARNIASQLSR
ncbi:MAG: HD domain-containing protein [Desulfobulbus sp.]|nr:HD domain-containing protein [Desulfobulbus sp.]